MVSNFEINTDIEGQTKYQTAQFCQLNFTLFNQIFYKKKSTLCNTFDKSEGTTNLYTTFLIKFFNAVIPKNIQPKYCNNLNEKSVTNIRCDREFKIYRADNRFFIIYKTSSRPSPVNLVQGLQSYLKKESIQPWYIASATDNSPIDKPLSCERETSLLTLYMVSF